VVGELVRLANLIRQTCKWRTYIGKLVVGELTLANLYWAKDHGILQITTTLTQGA